MGRPKVNTDQITFRVPRAWVAEAAELASKLSTPGMAYSRTDIFRIAIAQGFVELRAEAVVKKKRATSAE